MTTELEIQMEVERLLLRDFATDHQHLFTSSAKLPEPSAGGDKPKKKKFPRCVTVKNHDLNDFFTFDNNTVVRGRTGTSC